MDKIDQVKKLSIKEFGSAITQERYKKIAEQGLWESEDILIKKYFKTNSIILDIGCGSGRTTIELAQKGYKVIGVDITPEMISTAQKISSQKKLNIDYRIGDATNIGFSDDYFDGVIFANNGWAQIPGRKKRQKALNEICRVLKPGGYFILTSHIRYYTNHYLFFWFKEWIKFYILQSAGFKIRGIDFGDLFFKRSFQDKKLNQTQFIHIASRREAKEQIRNADFKLELEKNMGEISKKDADSMKGSLSEKYNSSKSPVFYVCQK